MHNLSIEEKVRILGYEPTDICEDINWNGDLTPQIYGSQYCKCSSSDHRCAGINMNSNGRLRVVSIGINGVAAVNLNMFRFVY